MAPTTHDLKVTMSYFDELAVVAAGADKPILSSVDRDLLVELAEHRASFDQHVDRVLEAARTLDWSNEETKQEYLSAAEEDAETVHTLLEEIGADDPTPLSGDEQATLSDAVRRFEDRAAGILEDI